MTRAETGAQILNLGEPDDSGTERMPVDVGVILNSGEPPKIRLLKEGETTEYCLLFESIFETTSYDTTTGDYTAVPNSETPLNTVWNGCTLTSQDNNTAILQCSVDGTLTITIDSEVQTELAGIETGAKYSFTLEDYVWKSSEPTAQLVMVHSFDTCATDTSRRRLLATGAIYLEGDVNDTQEVHYGPSSFDTHGRARDRCASHSAFIDSALVQQSDEVHIVFTHFECTLAMDPFFGLENEEYGFAAPTTTELWEMTEPGNKGMVYVAILISALLFAAFIVVGFNQMPAGTCACKKKDAIQALRDEDDIENRRKMMILRKGNDEETHDDEPELQATDDTQSKAEEATEDKEVEMKTKDETESVQKQEEEVQNEKGNTQVEEVKDTDTTDAVDEQAEEAKPVVLDVKGNDNTDAVEEQVEEAKAVVLDDAVEEEKQEETTADVVSLDATSPSEDVAVKSPNSVGTPVKVTLEAAWEAGAPDGSSSDSNSEEAGDMMGDLNSVHLAINLRAQQNLGTIHDMETPQSTAL
eukprot:25417_1